MVEVSTSGSDVPDGYEVRLDDGENQPIASNGALSFEDVAPGTHEVELLAFASNCAVDGSNPRAVVVSETTTSPVGFSVVCTMLPRGDLSVTTTTSGDDLDDDGYVVAVDGGTGIPVGIDDDRIFPDLPAGDHQVVLSGLASNCAVQGENPRTVPVAGDQTTATTFAVVCDLITGSIRVSASTSGLDQDPDGYSVTLDGMLVQRVEPDGTVSFEPVDAGDHHVTLGDISSNCEVEGDNPVDVVVTAGETADIEFDVECSLF